VTPRLRWVAGIAAVIALLGLGFIAGGLAHSSGAPGDASPEAGFARDMSDHHAQAVAMAMIAWQAPLLTDTPTDADVSQQIHSMAYDIALQQQNQIGQMAVWLQDWGLLATSSRPRMAWMPEGQQQLENGLMPGMATTEQLNELSAAKGKALYVLFCQLMLRHHQGGVHMVEGILAETHDQQVRDLAQTMKIGQSREIVAMQGFLTQLGAQPLPS
jgi:uncharacterized protein (DUF305 family)